MKLGGSVDVQIGQRIGHRIEMTGLAREIEKEVAILNQRSHGRRVTHVGKLDRHLVADVMNIEEVAAVFRNQTVDQCYLGWDTNKPSR